MITRILFFNTAQFAITVFSFFAFFAAGLLYFDSWQVDKQKKTPLFRSIGFFFLALVAIISASLITIPIVTMITQIIKILGLVLIYLSLVKEPILSKPVKDKILPTDDSKTNKNHSTQEIKIRTKKKTKAARALYIPFLLPAISPSLIPLSAVLTLLISLWYFRKSNEGLEKQLKPAAYAFLFLSFAEIVKISFYWSDTVNVFWSKMLADYGFVWIMHHSLTLIGIIILVNWIWGYVRFRLQTQLFVTILASTLVIFLTITSFFTFFLLKNLENDTLAHLETDVNVFQYALNRLQLEALSDAKAIAQDSSFQKYLKENNFFDLYKVTSDFMLSQNTSFLTVASSSGEVVMRAEDKEQVGDNISEDPIAKSAFEGNPLSTIIVNEGITNPEVFVKSAAPIKDGGIVVTGFIIDSAFVDGIKDVTGLDVAVFGGEKRAATTFVAPDEKSRFIGTAETNKKITDTVLGKGNIYVGTSSILNQPYYTAYSPLKTLGDKTIGMLFVGKPQTTLLTAAQKSINSTFLGSVILMILSIVPAYFLSGYIKRHVEA